MFTLKLAWRSFLRHRRRSVITASAVSLGLAMMLVFVGMADDGHRRMAELGVHLGAGHVVIQGKGFQEQQTLDYMVEDPERVMNKVRALRGVSLVVPRLMSSGLLSTGEDSAAVVVAGVDPRLEPSVSTIASPRKRVRGNYLRPRDELAFANAPSDIYIGDKLAQTLELDVGDRVVLTVAPRGGSEPASAAFIVRGIFRTGLNELDGFFAEISLDDATSLLDTGGAVTQVAVFIDDIDDTDAMTERVRAAIGPTDASPLETLSWKEALRELYEAIVLDDMSMYLMMAIIFIIVAIGIFNTILMSVVERTRELGVMMAIGTSARRVFAAVMAEAFMLSLVASAIGLAIGLGIHAWIASTGIDLAAFYGDDMEFAGIVFEGRIYSYLTAAVVVKWTLVVIGIVVMSAVYPAYRATRLDPVEAMQHV